MSEELKQIILSKWKTKISYPFNYKDLNELEELINFLEEIISNKQQRIDKAIKYIEKFIPVDNDTILMRERQRDYLLEILKGDSNG